MGVVVGRAAGTGAAQGRRSMTVDRLLAPALGTRPDATERRALSEMLRPGRPRLTGAGIALTAASAGTAAGVLAVAAVAQDVLAGRAAWPRDLIWLGLAAAGATLRAGAGVAAARLALDGALEVEQHLRSVLLDRLFQNRRLAGAARRRQPRSSRRWSASAGYAERYVPTRFATGSVPLVLLCAVFPMSWVVGVLLLLFAPLPPVNLSIVGMGTAAVARRHADELRHLSGYFLDRLRRPADAAGAGCRGGGAGPGRGKRKSSRGQRLGPLVVGSGQGSPPAGNRAGCHEQESPVRSDMCVRAAGTARNRE